MDLSGNFPVKKSGVHDLQNALLLVETLQEQN